MKTLKVNGIIHLFALLHVAVALTCRSLGIMDEIWLTMLSITMVTLIGMRMYAKVELITATVIVINLAGYVLGVYGAKLIALISSYEPLTHAISSFITTEIIGWSTVGFLNLLRKSSSGRTFRNFTLPSRKIRNEHVIWLAAALVIVILFRILLTLLFSEGSDTDGSLLHIISILMSRSGILVIMLCFIILLVRHLRLRFRHTGTAGKSLAVVCFAVAVSAAVAFTAALSGGEALTTRRFFQLFLVTLAIYLICYSIVYMIDYAFAARAAMYAERDKANYAQFQYAKLKQQVNPHFLFNSLNILDCMVQDGQNLQASAFIHKLAGIYRYMLRSDERTVSLKDELKFVEMYVDLLRERFPDGFEVETDIPEEMTMLQVVPCSVQMLIENAIKHNKVGGDGKLKINISVRDRSLSVSNNLRPKVSTGESTKVGLDYLRRQYLDLCGKEISINADENEYKVTIPLI